MTKPYQLFAANQSVTGFSRRPREFKLVNPGFLPMFGGEYASKPTTCAATSTARKDTPSSSAAARQTELPLLGQANAAPKTDATPFDVAPKNSDEETRPDLRGKPRAGIAPMVSARERHSLLKSLWSRRPRLRGGGQPVQCELYLAGVKVVRNDLADADLEVIASKRLDPQVRPDKCATVRGQSASLQWWRRGWMWRLFPLRGQAQ